eukprot:Seg2866.3 transcript_id=Seg2866.3/GoldUCD/mRNA.D3Y31 product="hypothetical protein" protein_id=Seg2866.3/GoldUCD/D3Y31
MKIYGVLALLVVFLAYHECRSTRHSMNVEILHKKVKINKQIRKAIRAYNIKHGTTYKLQHAQRAFFSMLKNGDKEFVIDVKTTPGVRMTRNGRQLHGFCEIKVVKKKKTGKFANGHVTKCATY